MKSFLCLLCAVIIGTSNALPSKGYKYGPQRAVMFGGYYGNPLFGRSYDVIPQGSMSAVVSKDAVATNTFAGGALLPPYPAEENETAEQFDQQPEIPEQEPALAEQEPELPAAAPEQIPLLGSEDVPQVPQDRPIAAGVPLSAEEDVAAQEEVTEPAKTPKRVVPKRKAKKPAKEQEDESDQDLPSSWPFGRGAVPSYNAFFPINISGGASRTRSNFEEGMYPGAATAIANSFSTGKGGIATSHATSFGDPAFASLFRNFNARKQPQPAQEA